MSAEIGETLKAWAAGIMDGEGSIMIPCGKNQGNYRVLVCAVNNDKRIIDIMFNCWQGAGRSYLLGYYNSTSTHVIATKKPVNTSYKVLFNLQDSQVVLNDILPYLIAKKDNAIVIVRAIEVIKHRLVNDITRTPYLTINEVLSEFYAEFKHLWQRGEKRRNDSAVVGEKLTKVLQGLRVMEERRRELAQSSIEPSEAEKERISKKIMSLNFRNLRRQLRGRPVLQFL
jgi:hypothetical protein